MQNICDCFFQQCKVPIFSLQSNKSQAVVMHTTYAHVYVH